MNRRHCLQQALASSGWLWLGPAWAGRQVEEPLIDSVRAALSTAVAGQAPLAPVFADAAAEKNYQAWRASISERLARPLPQAQIRQEFLQAVWYEAKRAGLDVALVLGLIQIESNFRKFAVSSAGARGYMQVMPFWTRLIGDGDASKLFDLQTNLRFGCVILRHYLDLERGDVFMALGRYNGSRGQAAYPDAVVGASKRWTFNN